MGFKYSFQVWKHITGAKKWTGCVDSNIPFRSGNMFVPRRKWLRIDDSNIPFRSGNGEAWDCYNRRVSDSNIPFRSGNDARLWTLPDRGERFKYSFQVWKRRNCSAALHHIHRFKYSFQVWKLRYASGRSNLLTKIQIFLSGLET